MNIIFTLVVTISVLILTFVSPDKVLSTMLSGGEKALNLTLKLIVIYAVWMGIFKLLEKTELDKKIAKLLTPVNKLLFGKVSNEANHYISMNISSNLLGMSGGTTPMGIKAVESLEKNKDTYFATAMFFVINATSIQLIPSSVLTLRISMNSASPTDIVLPTILATSVSTILGILLTKIFVRRK